MRDLTPISFKRHLVQFIYFLWTLTLTFMTFICYVCLVLKARGLRAHFELHLPRAQWLSRFALRFLPVAAYAEL